MLPVSFTPTGGSPTTGGYQVAGGSTTFMIWNASYRQRNTGADANSVSNREDDTCFIRGLREAITLRTLSNSVSGSAASWLWRRIVFSGKGLYQYLGTSVDQAFTSQGYVRFLANHNGTPYAATIGDQLFQGQVNLDWNDLMTAKTDNTRYTIHYDKVTRLNPHAGTPQFWRFKRWHSFNKNLVYANEESGTVETQTGYSTLGKPGMGDVYVIDVFQCATGAAGDTLLFNPEAAWYWHEK